MSRNYDEVYESKPSSRRTGFCGAISEMMSRKEQKLFPSMDDLIDEE
jgi:hypothetical protein